jgi:GNAT superfamily N-acetyltransferase/tRNA A-37 threonylcarbamoyl transferase component Bud32
MKPNDIPKDVNVISYLGKGKSAHSYLVNYKNQLCVYKLMHDEVHPNYTFESKIEAEIRSYERLLKTDIKIPKLITYHLEKKYLIKSYIEGETLAGLISKGQIDVKLFHDFFEVAKHLESQNINLDYFPTNFVYHNQELYYIDYELNDYDPNWSFENWGIYFWFNQKGFEKYLNANNDHTLLVETHTGKPLYEKTQKEVDQFLKQFYQNHKNELTIKNLDEHTLKDAIYLKVNCWQEELANRLSHQLDEKEEYQFYKTWMANAIKDQDVRTLISVFYKDHLLGTAFASFAESYDIPSHGFELNGLFVKPQARGLGISKMLLQEITNRYLTLGCKQMVCYCHHYAPANAYYHKLGAQLLRTDWQLDNQLKVDVLWFDAKNLNERTK